MHTITIKTEYIDKLKKLGVYDAWLSNVKIQYAKYGDCFTRPFDSFYQVVCLPLMWEDTPEGHDFWRKISNS